MFVQVFLPGYHPHPKVQPDDRIAITRPIMTTYIPTVTHPSITAVLAFESFGLIFFA